MPELNFSDLPDSARIWIYGTGQSLTRNRVLELESHMARFVAAWHSHERPVIPAWQLVYGRFVVIGADEKAFGVSGCSIDSMVRNLKDFDRLTGSNLLGTGGQVFYRDASGAIRCVERLAFTDLARQGVVDEETVVFNNVISTVGEFRGGRWEVPMRESWHIDVFGRSLAR